MCVSVCECARAPCSVCRTRAGVQPFLDKRVESEFAVLALSCSGACKPMTGLLVLDFYTAPVACTTNPVHGWVTAFFGGVGVAYVNL